LKKAANDKVAAFLHAQLARNGKRARPNCHGHALENKGLDEGCICAERVKSDPHLG
jgi:hypothetical protein